MTVNLSIKNVPDALAEKLRKRAEGNHRSLQGELMALLESALSAPRANQEPATYIVSNIAPEKSGVGDSASSFAVQAPVSTTLRQIWDRARTERRDEGPSSLQLLHEAREERSAHLMKLIDAPDAYARARALLGLTGRKTAKPQADTMAANSTLGRKSGSVGKARSASAQRVIKRG